MYISSPLNYTGGKYKLLPQLIPYFPAKINTFVDLFCGGCNVGINVEANKIIYNDINDKLINLFITLKNTDYEMIKNIINEIILKYNLSEVYKHSYAYYNCDSGEGLGNYNREKFLLLRNDFNAMTKERLFDEYYYIMFYVIIIYAFNNQIRFNNLGEYNLPVGKRDFNINIQRKLVKFLIRLKNQNCDFMSVDFRDFDISKLSENDFVYIDPPYLITCASYNEQEGWTEKDEKDLLSFIDELNYRNIKFGLSNVFYNKGHENKILIDWVENRDYKVNYLNNSYSNSNYHTKDKLTKPVEVFITNYKEEQYGLFDL